MIQATEVNFQCIAKGFIPVTSSRQIVKPRARRVLPIIAQDNNARLESALADLGKELVPLSGHPMVFKEHFLCSQAGWLANEQFCIPRGHVSLPTLKLSDAAPTQLSRHPTS
jgi:hypothetical protein